MKVFILLSINALLFIPAKNQLKRVTSKMVNKSQFEEKDSIISWKPNVKLTWNDFEGEVDELSTYKAMTFATIESVPTSYNKDSIVYNLGCNFEKKSSWSKDKQSTILLKHEQLHFDIAELAARKIRCEYSNHKIKELEKTYKELSRIFAYYSGKYIDSLNHKYDGETHHGVIEKKQKVWEQKIANELKLMDKYTNTLVIVKRR